MKKSNLINYLREKGFDSKIVDAFEKVERGEFVRKDLQDYAYADTALPIGYGQTISQPSTIAFMLSLLEIEDGQKILEVGSGSGYVLALLAEINSNGDVFGIERIKELAKVSIQRLKARKNVKIFNEDGSEGLDTESPFDRILVSASAEEIPKSLINQLRVGGILVTPIRSSIVKLKKIQKGKVEKEEFEGFCFVPLVKNT